MILRVDRFGWAVHHEQNSGRSFFELYAVKILSFSEAKMKLSALVDDVNSTDEEIVITKNGVPAAVLVSPDEFERWRETMAIRFDKESMDEIRAGLRALKEGRASVYRLDELFEG